MTMGSEESRSFIEFISSAQFRFLQERMLGLDLYYSGYLGIAVFCLAIAMLTVFVLAIFLIIPRRTHVLCLLLLIGVLAASLGTAASYLNFKALLAGSEKMIQVSAGPAPVNAPQRAAVIALPLLLGGLTLALSLLGCVYMALFWGESWLSRHPTAEKREPRP